MKALEGVLCLLGMPFTKDNKVNEEAMIKQIEWVIEQGADGIIPTGSAGEMTHLFDDEVKRVHEICIEHAPTNCVTVAGAGAAFTDKAIQRVKYAEDLGYDGVMVIPPYYWKVTDAEVMDHYKAIGKASDIQIMLYHNPWLSKWMGSVKFIEKMTQEIPTLVAMKDSHEDITRVQYLYDKLNVLRTQPYFLFNLMLGGKGGTIAPYAVPLCAKIYKLFNDGNLSEALKYQRMLTADWNDWWTKEAGEKGTLMVGQWKVATSLLSGIDLGPPRMPYKPGNVEKVRARMQKHGLI